MEGYNLRMKNDDRFHMSCILWVDNIRILTTWKEYLQTTLCELITRAATLGLEPKIEPLQLASSGRKSCAGGHGYQCDGPLLAFPVCGKLRAAWQQCSSFGKGSAERELHAGQSHESLACRSQRVQKKEHTCGIAAIGIEQWS